jgi:uncharacterized membrane protein
VEEKDTARTEAFSDGVFAIAITLLILDIKAPDLPENGGSGALARALLGTWPSVLAYLISFVSILVMWINHHQLFGLIERVNAPFLYANGLLLMFITFVPFPTAVLARSLESEAAPAAAAFYCGTFAVVNIAFNILWLAASAKGRHLLRRDLPEALVQKIRAAYLIGLAVYVAAAIVAWLSPVAGLLIYASLWLLWARVKYASKSEGL